MFELFRKNKSGRLAGTKVMEEFSTRPIPFRTYYGGSRPTDYIETEKMRFLDEELLMQVDSVINQGLIDEYTDPDIFDTLIEAYYKQIENEIERQYISFADVIRSIKNVAREELLRGKRDEETLKHYLEKSVDEKKGKGDSYVEIEK